MTIGIGHFSDLCALCANNTHFVQQPLHPPLRVDLLLTAKLLLNLTPPIPTHQPLILSQIPSLIHIAHFLQFPMRPTSSMNRYKWNLSLPFQSNLNLTILLPFPIMQWTTILRRGSHSTMTHHHPFNILTKLIIIHQLLHVAAQTTTWITWHLPITTLGCLPQPSPRQRRGIQMTSL